MGVSEEGGEEKGEISFCKARVLNPREGWRESERDKRERKKKEKAECFGVTILLLIALAVSVVQNMTLPSLSHDRNMGDWINTILCSD